jgi:hypothetical protein
MKTNQVIVQIQKQIRQYGILFLLLVSSFVWVGGCNDKKAQEIPADEISTDLQQAPFVPFWVPVHTNPAIRFYFIPEMGIYYDAFLGDYVYWNGSYWVYSPVLPHGHFYFDLFDANIVFLSIGINYPWHRHHFYVNHYPIYFFVGNNFKHAKHGWRFYNENGGRFHGAHKNIKYHNHYNLHHLKGGFGKGKIGIPNKEKNRFSSPGGIKKENQQKKNYHSPIKKGGGKNESPSLNRKQKNIKGGSKNGGGKKGGK